MKKSELKALIKEELNELFSKNLSTNFKVGDKIMVNDREGFKELVGLKGVVVGTNVKKGAVYINFLKKISGNGFATHDLNGLIPTETGLGFFDRGWASSKIDPRFDIRNLTKL